MKTHKSVIFIFFMISIVWFKSGFSQKTNDSIQPKKFYLFTGVTLTGYSATMLSLNQLWYKNYNHSSFHFFDDSGEWLQMDKIGHGFSSYYLSSMLSGGFSWTGMNRKKSVLWGTGAAFIAMSSIEVFDGFSSKWGASWTDATANLFGGILFAGQELAFKKQVLKLKFSFHPSQWAKYRPDALGENEIQQMVKDYNGQTYWLSGNLKSITGCNKMPPWINIAFGYSGEEMLGGNDNLDINWNISNGPVPVRYRQFYFSFDADLSQIKVKNRFLKSLLRAFNCIKIPFPALVLEKNKIKFNSLYF